MNGKIRLESVTKSYKGVCVLNKVTESFPAEIFMGLLGGTVLAKQCFLKQSADL